MTVLAVDPGDLHQSVLIMKNIKHIPSLLESKKFKDTEKYYKQP